LLDDLVGELTVGETYFFRDPARFDFIRQTVLPELRSRPGRAVRAWSAGCATGEEAYSLAMLFEQEGLRDCYWLLATDLSRPALERARQARYTRWSLRGRTTALPYLTQQGELYVVDERVRRQVIFEQLNLAGDSYPSPATGTWELDLVLCCNVLIYLDEATVQRVAEGLFGALAPGGWLITAACDPPLAEKAPFVPVVGDAGVFYRRPDIGRGVTRAPRVPTAITRETRSEERPAPKATLTPPFRAQESVAGPVLLEPGGWCNGSPGCRPERPSSLDDDGGRNPGRDIRALARHDIAAAERACAAAVAAQPLSIELHHLHAVLLMGLGRDDGAARALGRVVYLDRSLAAAHFALRTRRWRRQRRTSRPWPSRCCP
jgi:chemotaxis protein methyltransferase CheR